MRVGLTRKAPSASPINRADGFVDRGRVPHRPVAAPRPAGRRAPFVALDEAPIPPFGRRRWRRGRRPLRAILRERGRGRWRTATDRSAARRFGASGRSSGQDRRSRPARRGCPRRPRRPPSRTGGARRRSAAACRRTPPRCRQAGSATAASRPPPAPARRPDARTAARRRRGGRSARGARRAPPAVAFALPSARMRPLVRQDDPVLVRLDLQRGDQAAAGALDPVRPDVPLLERPEGRLLVPHEDAVGEPLAPQARSVALVVGSVRWTTFSGLRARSSSRCASSITS